MKKHLLAALALSLTLPAMAQQPTALNLPQTTGALAAKTTSGNPVFPGWYADPEGAVFGKNYWIYPTYSALYEQQTFMDAFSSPDLVNWTKHERILDTKSVAWASRALWAPAIIAKDNKYFLFFGANDIQNNQEIGGIGVAVADSPSGPFKDYLGKPLIGQIYNQAQPIDQFVFQDKDGKYYMIYGGWGHCNIAQLKSDFTGFTAINSAANTPEAASAFNEITPQGYVEGPFMFTRGGKYYFMWSEGGWGLPNYRVAYGMADSPFGPFERIGTVLEQDPTIANGAGHNSVIQVPGTDDWYMVYHRRILGDTSRDHRVTCIDKMFFDDKGLILPVKITNQGVTKQMIK